MPEICRFLGLVIFMFYDDHNPPHFHVAYGRHKAAINILTGELLKGKFPPKKLKEIKKWCIIHKEELLANWQNAKQGLALNHIKPL